MPPMMREEVEPPGASIAYASPATSEKLIPATANSAAMDLLEWPATTMATWRIVPIIVATTTARELSIDYLEWEMVESGAGLLLAVDMAAGHSAGALSASGVRSAARIDAGGRQISATQVDASPLRVNSSSAAKPILSLVPEGTHRMS